MAISPQVYYKINDFTRKAGVQTCNLCGANEPDVKADAAALTENPHQVAHLVHSVREHLDDVVANGRK